MLRPSALLLWASLASSVLAVPLSAHAQDAYTEAVAKKDWRAASRLAWEQGGPEGYARWADALDGQGLRLAALIAYEDLMVDAPAVGASRLARAIELAEELGDSSRLSAVLLKEGVPTDAPDATRGAALHLAARAALLSGDNDAALALIAQVPAGVAAHADALALRGVVLNQQGRPSEALAPLLTAQAEGAQFGKSEAFSAVMDLNLGRTFYAQQNYAKAIEYYAKVPASSDFWLQAQLERSWAHFALEDMQGTLGLLMNHEAPFFDDFYLAEADMLRAQAYFLMCKFPAARTAVEDFEAKYAPVLTNTRAALGSLDAAGAFEDVAKLRRGEATTLPPTVLRRFAHEHRSKEAARAVERADNELARLERVRDEAWVAEATALVQKRRQAIVLAEGTRVLTWARRVSSEVDTYLKNLKVTKLDILEYERSALQTAAVTGELPQGETSRRRNWRKQGTVVWPYEGEFWADELGSYTVAAQGECAAPTR